MTVRTLGVEEEFLLVDPGTGRPRAVGQAVLGASGESQLTGELQQEQVETATKPCLTLDELSRQIRSARSAAAAAAADVGVALVPLATSPLAVEPTIMPTWRYAEMARRFGLTVAEGLTCGCHVHVAVDSPEEGVAVLDRIRPWLAPLLALSANSPFWNGEDSGYRSYRTQVWQRWPSGGAYGPFGSAAAYRTFVDVALATGMGEMRNALIVRAADVVVALGGEYGTLSEVAFALKIGRPVVGFETWELSKGARRDAVVRVSSAEEAVSAALRLASTP